MISFHCPKCYKSHTARDKMQNRRGFCSCGAVLKVPDHSTNEQLNLIGDIDLNAHARFMFQVKVAIGLFLLIAILIGAISYFALRDTWERDNAPQIKAPIASRTKYIGEGKFEEAKLDQDSLFALTNTHSIDDVGLKSEIDDAHESADSVERKSSKLVAIRKQKEKHDADEASQKALQIQKSPNLPTIRCDQFELNITSMPGTSLDKKSIKIALKTDLPGNTDLIVSVDRSYYDQEREEYPESYFAEKSTVSDWKVGKILNLDHTKWQTQLNLKRKTFEQIGEKFNIFSIDKSITISFTVPVNQTEESFEENNSNLTGNEIQISHGMRIIQKESKLDWPTD